jgi:hypothetical protein
MTYDDMIERAAFQLEAAMRATASPSSVTVWAIPTTRERDGRLVVGSNVPEVERGVWPVVVWPSDNGASGHHSWATVQASALRSILHRAAGRQPILPIERLTMGGVPCG